MTPTGVIAYPFRELPYNSVVLEWDWLGVSVSRSYRVERSLSPYGPWEIRGTISGPFYSDYEKCLPSTTYYYHVIEIESDIESGPTAPVSVTTAAVS
jgi:hypothetical protein